MAALVSHQDRPPVVEHPKNMHAQMQKTLARLVAVSEPPKGMFSLMVACCYRAV